MRDVFGSQPTLADYLAILRRRKWLVVLTPLVAAATAYALSMQQTALYQAQSQVYVNLSSVVSAVANVNNQAAVVDPTRFLTTEASLARAPELARRVAAASGVRGMTADTFLGESSVTPSADADLLNITVTDRNPDDAVRLANAYAHEFTKYKSERDTASINEALRALNARAKSLRAHGQGDSAAYALVVQEMGQLETVGKLIVDNASVLQEAGGASKTQPRPMRNAVLGGVVGAVFGVALAFLGEALDRRVRNEKEVEQVLETSPLARIPTPPRRLRRQNELVMLSDPSGYQAETFRKLRTSIEFINHERTARKIMVTSAMPREGKSTTIANLAVALARAGRRVALVDLDLRRPMLHVFFGVTPSPGVSDVAVGRSELAQASRSIALTPRRRSKLNGAGSPARSVINGKGPVAGTLDVLPAGTPPPAPGEFIEDARIGFLIDRLAGEYDFVLIDAPPLPMLGDTMALSAHVDAIFPVVRLGSVPRPVLAELARQLRTCEAATIGFALTGSLDRDTYRYVYDTYGYATPAAPEQQERV